MRNNIALMHAAQKYDKRTRMKLRQRLRQLRRNGLTYVQAADQMNSEGFRKPDGTSKLDEKFVSNQCRLMVMARRSKKKSKKVLVKKSKPTPTQQTKDVPNHFMHNILRNRSLSDAKKIKMMEIYYS